MINAITEVFPVFMKGINITITVLVLSAILGYLIAFIAGLCRLSDNVFLRKFTGFYVEVFRGTSLIVQLFWFYYALPMLFGIDLGSDILAGVLAIALNYGAYGFLPIALGFSFGLTFLDLSFSKENKTKY